MTIARDNRTGEIRGQVVTIGEPGPNLAKTFPPNTDAVFLLTRGGRYVTVPRSSVRLEVLR
jgi:hypothetical protein